ncbi:MAG: glycosyltransferase family 4 protein [Thiohalomonadales bacterium]
MAKDQHKLSSNPPSTNRNLNILQIGPLPPPIGGIATCMQNLITALEPHCDVRYLNNAKSTADDRPLWVGILAQLKLLKKLVKFAYRWRPDVSHIHTCSYFTFWRTVLDLAILKIFGCKVVIHIHGAEFHKFLGGLGPIKLLLAKIAFKTVDRVIILSEGWNTILSPWIDPTKMFVLPNGTPIPDISPSEKTKPPNIICIANYERRKGQIDLLSAVSTLSYQGPLKLVLMGEEMETGQKDALRSFVNENNLENIVDIHGPVFGDKKRPFMENATIFCLPSYDEGLPLAMLEAMSFGLPVICTTVGAIPEVIDQDINGLLYNPGDTAALTTCLDKLLVDTPYALSVGIAGRQLIIQKYSINAIAIQLTHLYDELMTKRTA